MTSPPRFVAGMSSLVAALQADRDAAKADRDDYERRWLAECRAHGETRRALDALQATAPLACESCGHVECTCLDSDDRAYMARDHLESIISKP